jgi:transposase
LGKLNLNRKKTFHASEKITDEVKEKREKFIQEIKNINSAKLIFIDEMGVNLGMKRLFGRALNGERVYDNKPVNYGNNISMTGGLNSKGLIATMTIEGSVDGNVFEVYVKQVLVPQLTDGDVVAMDNPSAHKINGIEEAIEAAGAKLVYLPPYSPDYSPIELCWSKFKEFLRTKAARVIEELNDAITEGLNIITLKDIIGWFKHCGYCIEFD